MSKDTEKSRTINPDAVFAVFIVFICIIIASFFIYRTSIKEPDVLSGLAALSQDSGEPHVVKDTVPLRSARTAYIEKWCAEDDAYCASVTTDKPKDTLQALISAIPMTEAKNFKIRLSVEPVTD